MSYRWLLEKTAARFQTLLIAAICLQSIFLFEKYKTVTHEEMVVFHKTKESIIGTKKAKNFSVLHSFDSINPKKLSFLKNYKIGTKVNKMSSEKPIPNIIIYNKKKILVIDSLGIYENLSFQPDLVLLRQSPKINLERLILILQPKVLIADGSNYKSYVNYWRKTCQKHKLKFHYTGNNGAFVLNKKEAQSK